MKIEMPDQLATVHQLPGTDLQLVGEGSPTSFDFELDAEPERAPIVATIINPDVVKRDIIPAHLRTVQGVKATVKNAAAVTGHRTAFHAVRFPRYAGEHVLWALVAVVKVPVARWLWCQDPDGSALLRAAVEANDYKDGPGIQAQLAKRRAARGHWLMVQAAAVAVGLVVLALAPWWVQALAAPALVVGLARLGKPAHREIIPTAVVAHRFRRLNLDIVARGYYVAKLADPDKVGQQVTFATQMARDALNAGSQVTVDLPYGRTFEDAVGKRAAIASGLDVTISQVYLKPDKSSARRHELWVADVDPLSIPAGRTPLLDCKERDVWKPVPLGVDERGRKVSIPLVFNSLLLGAQPRKGKTFTARGVALAAAADPYVRISVFDGKGSPDWRNFALVAHTYGFGLLTDRVQGDPIENLLTTLRAAMNEVLTRNNRLSELPTSICPEGKLTRDIARDLRYGMPLWVIILDEFQEYFTTGDTDVDEEIASLLIKLVKMGPSAGVTLISSTQKPSGIGSTGKVATKFTDYRDQHLTRFALKCGSYQTSNAILGGGAYAEGFDASVIPVGDEYRGVGILYDAPIPDGNCTVRTYLADGEDALKILTAARRRREQLGTLDGMAAGQDLAIEARDPLADAIDAFHPGETFLAWGTLAGRLAEQLPDRYAQATGASIQKTLCGMSGIESKTGQDQTLEPGARPRGVYLAALTRAAEARQTGR